MDLDEAKHEVEKFLRDCVGIGVIDLRDEREGEVIQELSDRHLSDFIDALKTLLQEREGSILLAKQLKELTSALKQFPELLRRELPGRLRLYFEDLKRR